MDLIHGSDSWIRSMDLMVYKIERPRRNGSGIGFVSSRSVERKQKTEIFHCYNGSGGSSGGGEGLYGEKQW